MGVAASKNGRECTVRCRSSRGGGCSTSVERGPAQAVCQAQILNAKVLGSSSRRRHHHTTRTPERHLTACDILIRLFLLRHMSLFPRTLSFALPRYAAPTPNQRSTGMLRHIIQKQHSLKPDAIWLNSRYPASFNSLFEKAQLRASPSHHAWEHAHAKCGLLM
jgi:hypothetical protein